jgi:hypothetical protein
VTGQWWVSFFPGWRSSAAWVPTVLLALRDGRRPHEVPSARPRSPLLAGAYGPGRSLDTEGSSSVLTVGVPDDVATLDSVSRPALARLR